MRREFERNDSIKPYLCRYCFLFSYVCVNNKVWLLEFYRHKEEIEIVVRGDGNCFYRRAIALRRDEMNDREHEEIRRLCGSFIEKHPEVLRHYSSFRCATLRVS